MHRGRPIYREIEGLRIAVGLHRFGWPHCRHPRNMHDLIQSPFSPFALTIAKHPGVAFGRLYSMRIAPLRTRSGFVHAGHDPQWRGGPFESRMLWAIVRNGQYVKCSRD